MGYDTEVDTVYKYIIASKSAPIYHGTTVENAIDILESNELRANISNETETYGVSFTRIHDSAYGQVSLVIDQEKLSYNYKISPVYRDGISGLDLAEERVPKTIKNIRNYILEIVSNDTSQSQITLKHIRRMIVQYGDQVDLLHDKYVNIDGRRTYNPIAPYLKLFRTAYKYNIPIDNRLSGIDRYIDMYIQGIPDTEYIKYLTDKGRI